jgi:hypothetical protein
MILTRKLIPILACISLAGCITYADSGYYSSPAVNAYYGDGYYGSNDDYYDNGYYGNYGQYEYYGAQPSITFNFFSYGYSSGYSSYYPYYGYNSGYNNYRPCNSWSSYCYAYRPNYGWGYWPVYVYRPTHYHHHHDNKPRRNDDHYGQNNNDHNNNGQNNDNRPNRPNREPEYVGRDRPNQSQPRPNTRPTTPVREPVQYKTPVLPVGNNPYVDVKPIRTIPDRQQVDSNNQQRYRAPNNNVQIPRYEASERPVRQDVRPVRQEVIDEGSNQYYGVPTYNAQQPRPEYQERPARQVRQRDDINQHYGAPTNPQQRTPVQADRQNSYSRNDRNNVAPSPQPMQADRRAPPPSYNADVVQQQPQAQPRQVKQPRASRPERRESKKTENEQDD